MQRSLLALSLLLVAIPANAASRSALNRCSDATRELRGGTQKAYQSRDVAPLEVQDAISHINQHTDRYNRAQHFMDSAGPWDPKDPDLRECAELMQHERAYIESTMKKIEAARVAGEQQAPIVEAAKGDEKRRAFYMLAAVKFAETANAFENLKPAQAKALVDQLAPVEAACQKAWPAALTNTPQPPTQRSPSEYRIGGVTLPGNLSDQVDWWCWVSAHRTDLTKRALGNVYVTAERYGNHKLFFEEILKAGTEWSGSTEGWILDIARDEKPFMTGLRLAIGGWFAAFGLTVPEQPFPGLSEQITQIRAAVAAAAERNPLTPGADHDKAMEAGAKTAASKLYAKTSVVATWMDSNGWTIEQNALGIPRDRFRSGQVVYKVGADPWCTQRTFNYVEAHMGGGKYQHASEATLLPGIKVVKCK